MHGRVGANEALERIELGVARGRIGFKPWISDSIEETGDDGSDAESEEEEEEDDEDSESAKGRVL